MDISSGVKRTDGRFISYNVLKKGNKLVIIIQ